MLLILLECRTVPDVLRLMRINQLTKLHQLISLILVQLQQQMHYVFFH